MKVDECEEKANKLYEQWSNEIRIILDQYLPVSLLEHFEKKYEEIKENAFPGIQLGRIGLYIGDLKKCDDMYSFLLNRYRKYLQEDEIFVKAFWDEKTMGNFIFSNFEKKESRAKYEIEKILVKELKHFPIGDLEICLCNSAGEIDQYKKLSGFITRFPEISGGKIFTRKSEILDILKRYTDRIDDLMQKKLIGYADIDEFNLKNPSQKIAYSCLCITGFPSNFSEEMLELLQHILKQGRQCGIQVLLGYEDELNDAVQNTSRDKMIFSIINSNSSFVQSNDQWRNFCNPDIDMIFDKTESDILEKSFLEELEEQYHKKSNVVLTFDYILNSEEYFEGYSGDGLKIPIGRNEYGKVHYLEMGDSMEIKS